VPVSDSVTAMAEGKNTMIDSRNGAVCAHCRAPTSEPLWMMNTSRWQGARPHAVCTACRDERMSIWWYLGFTWLDPQPCAACGLLVCYPADRYAAIRRYVACSDACRQLVYRVVTRIRRQAGRAPLHCATCGRPFAPPRADGRYCAPACRQRAYRQRHSTPA